MSSGSLAGANQKVICFSTNALPERDRVAVWREEFGRGTVRCDFETLSSRFYANMTLRTAPDFGLASATHSAMRAGRTRELLADGDDSFLLQISATAGLAQQLGREIKLGPGDAVLTSNADVGSYTFPAAHSRCMVINLSRKRLRPLVRDLDGAVMRLIPANAPSLQLLTRYVPLWMDTPGSTPELERLAVSHIYDLVSAFLGPTRDAAEAGQKSGLRAAQLAEAKAFVLKNLADSRLSVQGVATHLAVSSRYIHMLFEGEAESFSEFVLARRLDRAHAMLLDPRVVSPKISSVALENGFGDLSYFNRTFRRRFQITPSQARNTKSA